ncbi:hypothetical protein O181_009738 [Austropuccinia psidii MF-1]|uniref:Uncharacterized protein n=1 Tax=Austropuccinia psidii MF-1 TaxID=1389203 RepID=A0A9Q3BRX9_9BASI|nr:hypothetical protein [Austropuccinia psidii MF-1]
MSTHYMKPNLDINADKMEAEAQDKLQKDLVKASVYLKVSSSISESKKICEVIKILEPSFQWPCPREIAKISTKLYFDGKPTIIEQLKKLTPSTSISESIDA